MITEHSAQELAKIHKQASIMQDFKCQLSPMINLNVVNVLRYDVVLLNIGNERLLLNSHT